MFWKVTHYCENQKENKGTKEIYEAISTENFSKLMLDTKPQTQGA